MTLNGRNALVQEETFHGAHHNNFNEDRARPISGKKMHADDSSFYMRIFALVPRRGALIVSGVVDDGNIRRFRFSSETLEGCTTPRRFFSDPKCMTLNDPMIANSR